MVGDIEVSRINKGGLASCTTGNPNRAQKLARAARRIWLNPVPKPKHRRMKRRKRGRRHPRRRPSMKRRRAIRPPRTPGSSSRSNRTTPLADRRQLTRQRGGCWCPRQSPNQSPKSGAVNSEYCAFWGWEAVDLSSIIWEFRVGESVAHRH